MRKISIICCLSCFFLSGCIVKWKTIQSGEIGVKKRLGVIKDKQFEPGVKVFFAGTKMYLVNTQVTEFTVKHPTRTLDGTLVTPQISFFVRFKEDKATEIISENIHNFRGRTVTPAKLYYLIQNIFKSSIASVVSKTKSFEDNNMNRERLAVNIKQAVESNKIMDYFIIDNVLVNSIYIDKVFKEVLNREVQLNKELSNIELEIELKRKKIILEKLEAISDSTYFSILKPSLDEKIIELEKIKTNKAIITSPNSKAVIISD
ncbi:MAG: SPFH domain-containing protein [Lishizhenia sp.]